MKEKIVLVGAGGHAHSCIDVIEQEGKYEIAGLIDKKERIGEQVLGYSILGSDEDLPELISQYKNVLITVGQIKTSEPRVRLYQKLKSLGAHFPVICSPLAYVSKHSVIQEGTAIMHGVIICANVKIGVNCIVNSMALCEHDCRIGDHCHISTASIINGNCEIGAGAFIGSNSVLREGSIVPEKTIVPFGVKHG